MLKAQALTQENDFKQAVFEISVPFTDPNIIDAKGNMLAAFRKEQTTIAEQELRIEEADFRIGQWRQRIATEEQAKADAQAKINAIIAT